MNSHVLVKSFYCDVVVSRLADEVARELISEFYIQAVNNLAFLIDGTVLMNDHQVLRLWIQKMIDTHEAEYLVEELKIFIRIEFMRLVKII